MENQRKEPRKKLVAFTPVYDLLHKTLLGYVGDLTLLGVMVVGEKRVEIGKHFTLGIKFPDSQSEAQTKQAIFSARVAWCRRDKSPQQFSIGFEFIDVSTENTKIIEAILARYQFRHVMDHSDLES